MIVGGFEVGDDDGAFVGIVMERFDLPVLRIGRINGEVVPGVGNPLIVGEEMARRSRVPFEPSWVIAMGETWVNPKSYIGHSPLRSC